jgi:SNF2 family DNA or RNA helicase
MHGRQQNGILADEMGLGKTLQSISLLACLTCEQQFVEMRILNLLLPSG